MSNCLKTSKVVTINVETWTTSAIGITKTWFSGEGLKPRCITRDLKWGTPVPLEGFKEKVFYVWFDAPIGYLSITAHDNPHWEKWWKKQDEYNVELHQFMGKDNVPFHSVIFPCTLLGTKAKWNLVDSLHTTEYLNYEDTKFSKSRSVGVFGSHVKETKIPISVWRYYLFALRPESGDTAFQWAELITRNNTELLANVGNFVNRVMKFTCHAQKYDGIIPEHQLDPQLVQDVTALVKEYVDLMEQCQIRQALSKFMQISTRGNQFLQESGLSNALFSDERPKCDIAVGSALNLAALLATLVEPFMPSTSQGILAQLNIELQPLEEPFFKQPLTKGHKLGKPGYLFSRIDIAEAEVYKMKFGGEVEEEKKPKKEKKKKSKSKEQN